MRIRVVRISGKPPESPLEAIFGDAGTIGRAEECTLVLPDPYKHISRVQAEIARHSGTFVLTDRGSSNPVMKGGVEVGRNRQVVIVVGDVLTIGDFELIVEAVVVPVAAAVAPASSQPTAEHPSVSATQFWGSLVAPNTNTDPFAQIVPNGSPGSPGSARHNALNSGSSSAPNNTPNTTPNPALDPLRAFDSRGSQSAANGGAFIPDDFDIFAPDPLPRDGRDAVLGPDTGRVAALDSGSLGDPLASFAGVKIAPSESLDQLFGLSGASANPLASDSAIGDPISQPNTAGSVDPLVALSGAAPRYAPPPVADRVPELQGGYTPPRQILPPVVSVAPVPAAPAASTAPEIPRGTGTMYRSWEDTDAPPRTTTLSRTPGSAESAVPTPAAAFVPIVSVASAASVAPKPTLPTMAPLQPMSPLPPLEPAVSTEVLRSVVDDAISAHQHDFQPVPQTRPTDRLSALNNAAVAAAVAAGLGPRGDAGQTRDFELVKAFLLGAGLQELPKLQDAGTQSPGQLTPELMRRIGTILRLSMKGTRDLLQARAMLKREMRTRMTMIVPRDNNPIKFSPDVASTLSQLLAPKAIRGFLEPVPAVQEAYNDLIAHQVGFVAGMRAAMQGLIERFDPQQLEGRLAKKSMVESMVPMMRRAKLWELFNELYGEIAKEAEDDFEALFGRAFVEAYEEQVTRLERSAEK